MLEAVRIWALLAACVAGCSTATFTISQTQDELQQKLARRFPVTKEKLLVTVTLSDPKVLLRSGDSRIGLDLATEVKVPLAAPVSGRIAVLGQPTYDAAQKAFFLQQATIETLAFPGIDLQRHQKTKAALEVAVQLALATTPVYTLEGRNFKEATAKLFLKEVHVSDGKLYLTLGP